MGVSASTHVRIFGTNRQSKGIIMAVEGTKINSKTGELYYKLRQEHLKREPGITSMASGKSMNLKYMTLVSDRGLHERP